MRSHEFPGRKLWIAAAAFLWFAFPATSGNPHRDVPPESPRRTEFRFLIPPTVLWSTPESFEVLTMTSRPAACSLRIREAGSNKAFLTVTGQRHGLIEANETSHRFLVPGLVPGGRYEYKLEARPILKFEPYEVEFGNSLETEVRRITLPRPEGPELRLAVVNDLHQNTPLIRSLMEKIEASDPQPDFVILNGDILSQAEGEEDIPPVFDLPGRYTGEHPMIWVRGNHECRGKFARQLTRFLPMPDDRYYYAFRRGPVQFLVLDNGEDKNDSDPAYGGLAAFDSYRIRQREWFTRIIDSPEWKAAPFRVLISHIPVGPLAEDEEEDPVFSLDYKRDWAEIMNRAGLDLEITAHYHRFRLEEPSDRRTFPVVVGGGPKAETAVIIRVHATEEILSLEVVKPSGEKIAEKAWGRDSRRPGPKEPPR